MRTISIESWSEYKKKVEGNHTETKEMDRLFPSIALAAVFLLNKREREREKMKTKTIDKRSRRGTGPISTSHPDSVPESKSSWPLAACLPASYSLAKGIESMFFLLFFPLHNTHTDSIYGLAHKFSWLKTSETDERNMKQ